MARYVTRHFIIAAATIGVACTAETRTHRETLSDATVPRVVRAAVLVAGGNTVRWVSRAPLCAAPIEVRTLDECSVGEPHPDSLYRLVRSALKEADVSARGIACLRLSREITHGDSSVVLVGTVSDAVVDSFAESSSKFVWFRRMQDKESMWIGESDVPTSDVAPMTESRC